MPSRPLTWLNTLPSGTSLRERELQQADARSHAARFGHLKAKRRSARRVQTLHPEPTDESAVIHSGDPRNESGYCEIRESRSPVDNLVFSGQSTYEHLLILGENRDSLTCNECGDLVPRGSRRRHGRPPETHLDLLEQSTREEPLTLLSSGAVGMGNIDPFDCFVIRMNGEMQMLYHLCKFESSSLGQTVDLRALYRECHF